MCTSLTCLQRKKPLVSATQNGQLEISLHLGGVNQRHTKVDAET